MCKHAAQVSVVWLHCSILYFYTKQSWPFPANIPLASSVIEKTSNSDSAYKGWLKKRLRTKRRVKEGFESPCDFMFETKVKISSHRKR